MADRRASYAWFMATRVAPQVYTGPVVRRKPEEYQQPSEQRTWMCPSCRNWTMRGAWRYGRCNWCDCPRPPEASTSSAPAAATATRRAR